MRVEVRGLDGTVVTDSATLEVLGPAPRLRLIDPPRDATADRPLRIVFEVRNAIAESVKISTRSGIEFTRQYALHNGRGVIRWTPENPGEAVLVIQARGRQGQVKSRTLHIDVAPSQSVTPPTVTLVRIPDTVTVGRPASFAFQASDCRSAVAQIEGPEEEVRTWRYPCPADPGRFTWTPTTAGPFTLIVIARGDNTSSEASVSRSVEEP